LFFLVEFKLDKQASYQQQARNFKNDMKRVAPQTEVNFDPVEYESRYRTLRTARSAVVAEALSIWGTYFSRVELSLPLLSTAVQEPFTPRWHIQKTTGSVLFGILDDGCPFAASQFLRTNAAASTRILGIWDQDQGRKPVEVTDSSGTTFYFGQKLAGFNYGLEYLRQSGGQQIGLNDWLLQHLTPSGSIDEDGCYGDAEFRRLKGRESHGAHVMDVLAGRIPTSSRIGPSSERRDPPSWKNPTNDPAGEADIVFVQFPENCIRDATGVWLKAYVLDGIRYIMSFADPNKIEKVVVNVSYGPTTGPHDGTAVLEQALNALVAHYDGTTNKPKLDVCLAAGNSYRSNGHVSFNGGNGPADNLEWIWRLPPDNKVLCFAEVWVEGPGPGSVTVELWPPGAGAPRVISPIPWGNNTMWRLEVGPTIVEPGTVPEQCGDYTIKVSGIPSGANLHAYVARTDPNMGVITGAKLSHFVDWNWDSAEASCKYSGGEFDDNASLISRHGTLNGIATAKDASVHVAGGYILANRRKSSYSSAGPARGTPLTRREGPDYALFCDDSYALQGVRAGGNRSGTVFRLIGTSTAAPQLARQLGKGSLPAPTNPPMTSVEREKRGAGNIEPP
jgi:hypothetical protein